MNGALTLAKYSSEVSKLDKNTQHYGKTGTYVAQLAKKYGYCAGQHGKC